MAISLRATGAWAELTADGAVSIPGGAVQDDRMYLFASWKDFAITATVAGWTELTEFANGSTGAGNGTGSMKVGCWYKDHTGSESNPTLDFSSSPNIAGAVITVMQKGVNEAWDAPAFATAAITSATTWTATASSNPGIIGGDVVMGCVGFCDDSALMTRNATTGLAAAGVTWAANVVESPATHHTTTTGFDMAADLVHRFAASGSASAAPTMTGTLSAADPGTALWVRQRVTQVGYFDSGTVLLTLTPSGTEKQLSVDSSTVLLTLTPSGSDIYEPGFTDAATAKVKFTPSALDNFYGKHICGMPNTNFDGGATGLDTTYPPAGDGFYTTDDTIHLNKSLSGADHSIGVALVAFDTSGIPNDAIIISATLRLYITTLNFNMDNRSVVFEYYDFDEIGVEDFTSTVGSNAHSGTLISDIIAVDDAYFDFPLQNINNINVAGGTGFRGHVTGGIPTGPNFIDFNDTEIGNAAILEVVVRSPTYDADVVTLTLTPSGSDTYTPGSGGTAYTDSDTVYVDLLPSGTEEKQTYDSGIVTLSLTPSAAETAQFVDSGTVALALTPSGNELAAKEYLDSATELFTLTPSGTEFIGKQTVDSDTALVLFTPSAAEGRQQYDAVTVPLALTPSATEEHATYDVGTVLLALSPSAAEGKQQYDTDTVLLALVPSSSDRAAYVDAVTAQLILTPSGTEHQDGPGAQNYTDSGTLSLVFTISAVEKAQFVDSATIPLLFSPSATEERQMYDAVTALLALSPSGTDAYGTTDTNTVRLSFTPSGIDERSYFDTETGIIKFTPSATDTTQFVDSAVILLGLVPSGTDKLLGIDTAIPVVVLTPSGSDQYLSGANADTGTLYLRLTPITISEIRFLFDTLLAATVYRNYDATVIQAWSGSMSSHWFAIPLNRMWSANLFGTKWAANVAQRWITNYKGRG